MSAQHNFKHAESGQGLIEYALLILFVGIAAIFVL